MPLLDDEVLVLLRQLPHQLPEHLLAQPEEALHPLQDQELQKLVSVPVPEVLPYNKRSTP
jgi:hypothetical protein